MGHQSDVKLEPRIFLVYYVKHLLQAQPVFAYIHTLNNLCYQHI